MLIRRMKEAQPIAQIGEIKEGYEKHTYERKYSLLRRVKEVQAMSHIGETKKDEKTH